MKARATTFFLLIEEEKELIEYLTRTGSVVAYTHEAVPAAQIKPVPLEEYLRTDSPRSLYVTPAEFSAKIKLVKFRQQVAGKTQLLARIDTITSHVVYYQRPIMKNENRLAPVSLSYHPTYFDHAEKKVKKAPGFIDWAEHLYRWVGDRATNTIEALKLRASDGVIQAIEKQKLPVAAY